MIQLPRHPRAAVRETRPKGRSLPFLYLEAFGEGASCRNQERLVCFFLK